MTNSCRALHAQLCPYSARWGSGGQPNLGKIFTLSSRVTERDTDIAINEQLSQIKLSLLVSKLTMNFVKGVHLHLLHPRPFPRLIYKNKQIEQYNQ